MFFNFGNLEALRALLWSLPILLFVVGVAAIVMAIFFRVVVKTNTVHIVQRRRSTTSYGAGLEAGNVYYRWPSWMPLIGVVVVELPVSNFDLSLKDYEAYDKERVPFVVDVTSFYRIVDTNVAAQRVSGMPELREQLTIITQGAVRKVLADADIDAIMVERARFGASFTNEVGDQLKQWGAESVKAMELMDIRDAKGGSNIANIMAKRTSGIEAESRKKVAENKQAAREAEIAAEQAIAVKQQAADEFVGKRTAERTQVVGIADQNAEQAILGQKEETAKKEMAVTRVREVQQAEIAKEKAIVTAEQEKQKAVLKSEGDLQSEQNKAAAIEAVGRAQGEAETAKLRAPVVTQIELAKEIGGNDAYQQYLQAIKSIEVAGSVGMEQAKALQHAEIKVIANADGPANGLSSVMDLFTAKGGKGLGFSLEALAGTPLGEKLLERLGVKANTEEQKAE